MEPLFDSLITYRIAVGPNQGRKVFNLQTLLDATSPLFDGIGEAGGFSLHAGVSARAHQRAKLERLCRYISRPAISEKRLSLTRNGNVRYELKTPYRDGTTHVIFGPLDVMPGPAWQPWCRNRESTSPAFTACSRPTVNIVPAQRRAGKEEVANVQRMSVTCPQRSSGARR